MRPKDHFDELEEEARAALLVQDRTLDSARVKDLGSGTLHDPVTLSGTPSYITIAAQVITRALIDLASHVTGTLGIGNGGTGQTTRQAAINALTDVASATNEHVLTKDTATGNAIFKAAAGGGGGSYIQDADADTKVHTEKVADEDKVRMDVAGSERLVLQNTSPHLSLWGDLKIVERISLGNETPEANTFLTTPVTGGQTAISIAVKDTGTTGFMGIKMSGSWPSLSANQTMDAIYGVALPIPAPSSSGQIFRGLNFSAGGAQGAGATVTEAACLYVRTYLFGFQGTISALYGINVGQYYSGIGASAVFTTFAAININTPGNVKCSTAYGIKMADITAGTTKILLELGPATPNLRLEAGSPSVSGESKLLLAFYDGAAVSLKRVLMGAADSGGAGYRTLRVAN